MFVVVGVGVGDGVGDAPTRESDDATPAVVDVSTPSDLDDERDIATRVVDASATRSTAVAAVAQCRVIRVPARPQACGRAPAMHH